MVFKNNAESIKFPVPYKGIDVNKIEPEYAKYLENILISDNNGCEVRNGTNLIAEFPFDEHRKFTNQIALMSFLKTDGGSEKIIYQNYLEKLPYLDTREDGNLFIESVIDKVNVSRLTLELEGLTEEQRLFIKTRLYDGCCIYIKQDSLSQGADISDIIKTETTISFTLPFPIEFFDRMISPYEEWGNFDIWWERGALYKLEATGFNLTPLREDLDPNVIISKVNFQGKLLITNGIDPVMIYDGDTVVELVSKVKLVADKGVITKVRDNQLTFTIAIRDYAEALILELAVGLSITIYDYRSPETKRITTITTTLTAGVTTFLLTLDSAIAGTTISAVEHTKPIPRFGFLAVARNRLWAASGGHIHSDKFRGGSDGMTVYYADTLKTTNEWFGDNVDIGFIDLSTNISVPDNIEAIVEFQGKVVFIGRETTHVYAGNNPKVTDDGQGQNINFKLEKVFKIGIVQRTLFVEVPNDIIFLSKYGIVAMSSINKYQQLAVSYNFSNGIADYVKYQLEYTYTDREYRNLRAFLYPYGRFLGFKLNYNCLIYQLKENGNWTIFSGDFGKANSIFYDNISQDLFLGMEDGVLLKYADKVRDISYQDYDSGNLNWKLQYNWITPQNTWNNEKIAIGCRSLNNTKVNVEVFVDLNDGEAFKEEIIIEQSAGLYDISNFEKVTYSYVKEVYADEDMRFQANSLMLSLSGSTDNKLILNNIMLMGGLVEVR